MILVFHIFFDYGIQWKLYFDDLRSRSTIKGQLHKLSWKLPILVPSRHSQSGLVQNFETPALPQDFGRRREFSKFRIWEVPKSVVSPFFLLSFMATNMFFGRTSAFFKLLPSTLLCVLVLYHFFLKPLPYFSSRTSLMYGPLLDL